MPLQRQPSFPPDPREVAPTAIHLPFTTTRPEPCVSRDGALPSSVSSRALTDWHDDNDE